jgi:hypothetical protein
MGQRVAYTAEISRKHPTLLFFLIDRSTSMAMKLAKGPSKAVFLADVINKTLSTLITTCTKSDGVRDYFFVAIVGYSGHGARAEIAGPARSPLAVPISYLASHPLRIEERERRVEADTAEPVSIRIKFPIWVEAKSQGKTSMCAGLRLAKEVLQQWCAEHPVGYPPTVLHVTDGHPTDGDPEPIANDLTSYGTEDGACLMMNLHVDIGSEKSIVFPNGEGKLKDKYAKKLFRMSSELPISVVKRAVSMGYAAGPGARGFAYNASLQPIVDFFELGTRAATLSDR